MATTSQAMGAMGMTRRPRSALAENWSVPDRRRMLQLTLATAWLLDAVLQFQPYMFTRAFGNRMIAGALTDDQIKAYVDSARGAPKAPGNTAAH